jgi:hypothetical protein
VFPEKLVCKQTSATETRLGVIASCTRGSGSVDGTKLTVTGLNWDGVVDGGPSGMAVGMWMQGGGGGTTVGSGTVAVLLSALPSSGMPVDGSRTTIPYGSVYPATGIHG